MEEDKLVVLVWLITGKGLHEFEYVFRTFDETVYNYSVERCLYNTVWKT